MKIKRIYGYPFKSHGQWSEMIKEEETDKIIELRFKSSKGVKNFNKKYKKKIKEK